MSPVTAVATKPASTRDRLIEAAHSLIWANSYAHVSVDDICRAAGVQKGSFYHFFPTKADLAVAAIEDHWSQSCPEVDEIFAGEKTPQEQLTALCAAILEDQKESLERTGKVCGCPYATLSAEMSGQNEMLFKISREISECFLGYYEQMLNNAVKAKLIPASKVKQRAVEMQVYVLGAMFHARMTNTLDSVSASLETALMRIAGLAPAKAAAKLKAVRPKKS